MATEAVGRPILMDRESMRATVAAFDSETVHPVREPVQRLNRLRENYRAQAERVQQNAPLHTRGLVEAMGEALAALPDVRFDDSKGVVLGL